MGLDMYAFSVKPENAVNDIEVVAHDSSKEIAYWRKFYALHDFMEAIFRKKGGHPDDSFNCRVVRLDKEDLADLSMFLVEQMSDWISGGNLDSWRKQQIDDTNQFVRDARAEIEKGNYVYYDCWY